MNFTVMAAKLSHQKVPPPPVLSCRLMDHAVTRTGTNGKMLLLLSCFSRVQLSVRPHRRQPTRLPRPWDSPGKNTGVGCHFLLQCVEVKSESEVAQSYPTPSDPWTAAYEAPPSMGFSRQEYWSGVPLPSLLSHFSSVQLCVTP